MSDTPRTDKALDYTAPEKIHRLAEKMEREIVELKRELSLSGASLAWEISDFKKMRAEVLELLGKVTRDFTPIFEIYDNNHEAHEMPLHYPSPDGCAITLNKLNVMITKLEQ